MNPISADPTDEATDARRRVEAYCQTLVDAGDAQWRVGAEGGTELHLASGERYRFGEFGVTRLK